MARLTAEKAFIHPECEITDSQFGAFVEIGKGSRVAHSTLGDYSYCDRYADIANAQIAKFSSIARMITGMMQAAMRRSLPTADPGQRGLAMTPGLARGR